MSTETRTSAFDIRLIIALLTGPSWSMMTESHFSQPPARPAHAAR